eukprot:7770810-Pyramimonas_sp.AAC.1
MHTIHQTQSLGSLRCVRSAVVNSGWTRTDGVCKELVGGLNSQVILVARRRHCRGAHLPAVQRSVLLRLARAARARCAGGTLNPKP